MLALIAALTLQPIDLSAVLTHGPFIGHVTHTDARIWIRAAKAGEYVLTVTARPPSTRGDAVFRATASPDNDLCLTFDAANLPEATSYGYSIAGPAGAVAHESSWEFSPAPRAGAPARVVLALGSCANDLKFPIQPVWGQIASENPDAMVLLGDTPYIDSTDLATQRARYRQFYSLPGLRGLLSHTPFYTTWDDHDFGRNDTDGKLEGREHSRRAFVEYHANPGYGGGDAGIYTHFRRGPVEVFLLDARWFSGREESEFEAGKPALLGTSQWKWLRDSLRNSDAPFKLLCSGMIWNEAVRPGKTDYWMAYPHERAALFRFIADEKIPGILLVGGDIHRSRLLRHPTAETGIPYPLYELITSPLAQDVIESAKQPSPYLIHDAGESQSFLILAADDTQSPPTLRARWLAADGRELFTLSTTAAELAPAR